MRVNGDISTGAMLDRLPVGVGVFDQRGVLVDANARFLELVPGAAAPAPRCCDLFGCRAPGPLHEGCLTEMARAAGGTLPEVRLDVGPDTDRRSVWVLASGGGDDLVLVHVRPGALEDRRRRTIPHWTSGPRLVIRALGPMLVSSPEGPISGAWVNQRSGQLLKLLLCRRHEVPHREELAATLWPDVPTATALTSLRHTVFQLRRRLEPALAGTGSFIATVRNGYRIAPEPTEIDADVFEALLRRAGEARVRRETDAVRDHLHRAMGLYTGPFLADERYTEWVFPERDRLTGLAREAFEEAATLDEEAGDTRSAINALRHLTDLEPLDLATQRRLLRLLTAEGRYAEATERRKALAEHWRRAFGQELR
jgi:DNA-binding SARP family transcriptional activator